MLIRLPGRMHLSSEPMYRPVSRNRGMRLIYVTAMLPCGPMESFIIPEIQELRARGHEVLVVPMYPRGPIVHDDAKSFAAVTRSERLVSAHIVRDALKTFGGQPRSCL